jgi:hypothetical protein
MLRSAGATTRERRYSRLAWAFTKSQLYSLAGCGINRSARTTHTTGLGTAEASKGSTRLEHVREKKSCPSQNTTMFNILYVTESTRKIINLEAMKYIQGQAESSLVTVVDIGVCSNVFPALTLASLAEVLFVMYTSYRSPAGAQCSSFSLSLNPPSCLGTNPIK